MFCLGKTLAHAWPPAVGFEPGEGLAGDLHLDDEDWREGEEAEKVGQNIHQWVTHNVDQLFGYDMEYVVRFSRCYRPTEIFKIFEFFKF